MVQLVHWICLFLSFCWTAQNQLTLQWAEHCFTLIYLFTLTWFDNCLFFTYFLATILSMLHFHHHHQLLNFSSEKRQSLPSRDRNSTQFTCITVMYNFGGSGDGEVCVCAHVCSGGKLSRIWLLQWMMLATAVILCLAHNVSLQLQCVLVQGSATSNSQRAIWACFSKKKDTRSHKSLLTSYSFSQLL